MEKNAGYTIKEAVTFENGRGFALGENPKAPNPFVTWQFTVNERGKRDYFWAIISTTATGPRPICRPAPSSTGGGTSTRPS